LKVVFRGISGVSFQSMLNALENKNISHERIHSPMPQNNIIEIKKPEAFVEDPITEVLRTGAKKLLSEALEAEIESFLRQYKDLKDSKGRQRITGYLPSVKFRQESVLSLSRCLAPGIVNRITHRIRYISVHP
jgi:hypothetical protein